MNFQPDSAIIRWRIHLASPPVQVYQLLATDEGRRRFWAEPAIEREALADTGHTDKNEVNRKAGFVHFEQARRYGEIDDDRGPQISGVPHGA